jgi:hypothetical protein
MNCWDFFQSSGPESKSIWRIFDMSRMPKVRKFLALDTETIQGKAFMLTAGNAEAPYMIESWDSFAAIVPELGAHDFVFYNLDYDATALLAHIDQNRARQLYYTGQVELGGSRINYIPKKFFSITDKAGGQYRCYDLYSFFQMSLDAAVSKFLPGVEGKAILPQDFWKDFDREKYFRNKTIFDRYAVQDAKILQQLVDKFFLSVETAGLRCLHYYSPASLSKKYIRRKLGRTAPDLREYMPLLERAYFGGRIECHRRGYFPAVNIYDIKSAYPAVMRELPDFRFPRLWYSKGPESQWYLAECRVKSESPLLPYRHRNKIYFPSWAGQSAVVTNWELAQLQRYGADVTVSRVLNIGCESDNVLRPIVDELYDKRAAGGMDKQVYKLVLNSLYGVFAQKVRRWQPITGRAVSEWINRRQRAGALNWFLIGQAAKCRESARYWEKNCSCAICQQTRRLVRASGKYKQFELRGDFDLGFFAQFPGRSARSNMLFALFTTAGVRVRISDYIQSQGGKFIACATDSIMTEGELELSDGIGGLELQYQGPLTLVGSGVYQTTAGVKFRGFEAQTDLIGQLRGSRSRFITVPQTQRHSLARYSCASDHFMADLLPLNLLYESRKKLDIDFDKKRFWLDSPQKPCNLTDRSFDSRALKLGPEL